MKTTMIRYVLTVVSVGGPLSEDAPEAARRATDELKALEESHAYVAKELLHLVRLLEPLEKDGRLEVPGLATLNGARAALRKAGLL